MEATKESVVEFLEKTYTEEKITDDIDDCMSDYLDSDWEDEFEDEYSAYLETGNGEAELHVCTEIYEDILKKLNMTHQEYSQAIGEEVWDTVKEVFDCLDKS
jgi:hypothetical protein